jgi:hypothetical protein
MLPLVTFPDVELVTTAYLRTALAARPEACATGVKVGTRTPNPRPARLITIRRDGGPRLDVAREAARIGVNVWAATEQDVSDLANLVRALLWSAPNGAPICKVTELTGPTPVVDASATPLRYMTFELLCRGSDLT